MIVNEINLAELDGLENNTFYLLEKFQVLIKFITNSLTSNIIKDVNYVKSLITDIRYDIFNMTRY